MKHLSHRSHFQIKQLFVDQCNRSVWPTWTWIRSEICFGFVPPTPHMKYQIGLIPTEITGFCPQKFLNNGKCEQIIYSASCHTKPAWFLSSVEHKRRCFFFFLMLVIKQLIVAMVFHSTMATKSITSVNCSGNKISLAFNIKKKQFWNNMRMSKWWQNLHFWVNFPFTTASQFAYYLS